MQSANVHPVFAEVLGRFAAIPQQVAAARAVKCRVTVKTESDAKTYDGIFPSTCDAVIDALHREGRPCKVKAQAVK
jgi:hypothetical protein